MNIELDKYRIVIHREALTVLGHFTQREKDQPEAGGIILGKIISDQINILKLSPPTELDKFDRTNFERHRLSAQIVIDYEYINSYKEMTYLGEWHTHPENHPTPSNSDRNMIIKQFSKNSIHTDFLILLIKGLKSLYVGICTTKGLEFKTTTAF